MTLDFAVPIRLLWAILDTRSNILAASTWVVAWSLSSGWSTHARTFPRSKGQMCSANCAPSLRVRFLGCVSIAWYIPEQRFYRVPYNRQMIPGEFGAYFDQFSSWLLRDETIMESRLLNSNNTRPAVFTSKEKYRSNSPVVIFDVVKRFLRALYFNLCLPNPFYIVISPLRDWVFSVKSMEILERMHEAGSRKDG